jgi:hypothetical protein
MQQPIVQQMYQQPIVQQQMVQQQMVQQPVMERPYQNKSQAAAYKLSEHRGEWEVEESVAVPSSSAVEVDFSPPEEVRAPTYGYGFGQYPPGMKRKEIKTVRPKPEAQPRVYATSKTETVVEVVALPGEDYEYTAGYERVVGSAQAMAAPIARPVAMAAPVAAPVMRAAPVASLPSTYGTASYAAPVTASYAAPLPSTYGTGPITTGFTSGGPLGPGNLPTVYGGARY